MNFYSAAFFVLLLAYELPHWIPPGNRSMNIFCELIIFLLCEIATCTSIIKCLYDVPHFSIHNQAYPEQMILVRTWHFAAFYYMLMLWPFVSTFNHSLLIYHTIRKVSVIVHCLLIANLYYCFILN